MKAVSSLLLLIALCKPIFAEERLYQVEILIFANNSSQGLISEYWRPPFYTDNKEADTSAQVLHAATTPPLHLSLEELIEDEAYPFEALADQDKLLAGTLAAMRKNWQYRPLLYLGWRQLFTREAEPIPMRFDNKIVIKEADPFLVKANELSQAFGGTISSENTISSNDNTTPISIEATEAGPMPLYELSGTAEVTFRRYLHVDLDLHYNRLVTDQDTDQVKALYASLETDYLNFRLDETRRMRSKQIHYFDHPTFGVVTLITPIENTEKEAPSNVETSPLSDNNDVETQVLE